MKAKKRYTLFLSCCAFLILCYLGGRRLKGKEEEHGSFRLGLPSLVVVSRGDAPPPPHPPRTTGCRMETCFNFTRCLGRPFRVYVYPDPPPSSDEQSASYAKILQSIRESAHSTDDPDEACLFVLSLDTLDRDPISVHNYVRALPGKVSRLAGSWNGGENHLVFNLFSGTYPDYLETDLGFDTGKAILAKGSISEAVYRPGFDVSMPLFQASHPARGGRHDGSFELPAASKNHFLAFKGKRYLFGIGSEVRNSLHHLHNGRDVVLPTTCKHGKNWKEFEDERCGEDNKDYDRWDYQALLRNSTFCLVPRGRRLGSFRFIETLQAGCVPVLLSNGWRLPFAEVIDWSQAVFQADERLLMQVPEMLRSVSPAKIFAMRQQTQFLWDRYLSSVDKIVQTTIEIVKERVYRGMKARDGLVWNAYPGGLLNRPGFSSGHLPFGVRSHPRADCPGSNGCDGGGRDPRVGEPPRGGPNALTKSTSSHFTAVIFTQLSYSPGSSLGSNHPMFKLVANVGSSQFVDKIIIYWTLPMKPPPLSQWPLLTKRRKLPRIHVVTLDRSRRQHASSRFDPNPLIATDAVLSLDDDSSVTTEEVDFAFSVWKSFPDRLVGFPARNHYFDHRGRRWVYTSKWSNEYSMVLTGLAFYHRYYSFLYSEWLPPALKKTVDQVANCEDILMNFLVSHVTGRPPIKVTQRKNYKEKTPAGATSPWDEPDHFSQRQACTNAFVSAFGYMPLKKSVARFDPVLYKDDVSSARKKYPKMERVPVTASRTP